MTATDTNVAFIPRLLQLAVPRLTQMMGAEPTMGEMRSAPDIAVDDTDQFVTITIDAERQAMRIGVRPPEGAAADSVARVAATIAEEWVQQAPTIGAGVEVLNAPPPDLAQPREPVVIDFLVADRIVGSVVMWLGNAPDETVPPIDPTTDETLDLKVPTPLPTTTQENLGAESVVGDTVAPTQPPADLNPAVGQALGNLSQVELDVTVELGAADLTMRELMELTPGSVVRVGTQIGEPFSILVNGRVAAKGDLVVVNGRLGVRIRELISG